MSRSTHAIQSRSLADINLALARDITSAIAKLSKDGKLPLILRYMRK